MKRVYFIKPIGMDGPVKIGCSVSPQGRLESLDMWSPIPLEIVADTEGGLALEKRFHYHFAASHDRREWYRWSPEIAAVVAAINAGTFDASILPEKWPSVRRGKGRSYSHFKGVRRNIYDRFQAYIAHRGKRYEIGSFATEEEAARAYDCVALGFHGNPGRLNFDDGTAVPTPHDAFRRRAARALVS